MSTDQDRNAIRNFRGWETRGGSQRTLSDQPRVVNSAQLLELLRVEKQGVLRGIDKPPS